jgi:hypothetical protein
MILPAKRLVVLLIYLLKDCRTSELSPKVSKSKKSVIFTEILRCLSKFVTLSQNRTFPFSSGRDIYDTIFWIWKKYWRFSVSMLDCILNRAKINYSRFFFIKVRPVYLSFILCHVLQKVKKTGPVCFALITKKSENGTVWEKQSIRTRR